MTFSLTQISESFQSLVKNENNCTQRSSSKIPSVSNLKNLFVNKSQKTSQAWVYHPFFLGSRRCDGPLLILNSETHANGSIELPTAASSYQIFHYHLLAVGFLLLSLCLKYGNEMQLNKVSPSQSFSWLENCHLPAINTQLCNLLC